MPRLDPAQCGLLRDEPLVQRYNAVHEILEKAVRELPRFGERQVVSEVRGELSKLAALMTRERFAIGFIGPSQAGKSTTVSNLLLVSKEESPAPQGGGGPTTSIPTRMIPRREPSPKCLPGQRHAIELHFFSRSKFRGRIEQFCDILQLPYDDDPVRLRDAVRALEQDKATAFFKVADRQVLLQLLEARIAFPEVITDEGRVDQGDYERRADYVTHGNEVSKYTLLEEVRIEFVTEAVSPEIEMIDLPGLGVDKESDARLTLAFVPQLDGAFLFQEGRQQKSAAASQLAEKMRSQHVRTLGERIWMVVTLCDALNDNQIKGPGEGKPSTFCHLADMMRQQGIKHHNVIFVGNEYYQFRLAAGLGEDEPPTEPLRQKYESVLKFDASGQPLIPELCRRNEGQVEPWRQFVLNSGIPDLRRTMQSRVADAVREQTRRDVTDRLMAVIDRLSTALQAAEQQTGMSVDEMLRATFWSGELDRLSGEIGIEPHYFQDATAGIVMSLGQVIANWPTSFRGGFEKNHGDLSGVLASAGQAKATEQTKIVLDRVKAEIERRSLEQPPPRAAGLPTPLEHWADAAARFLELGRTSSGRDFRGPIFQGIRTDPSPLAAGEANLNGEQYLKLMRDKVGRAARVFGSRLVHEIQEHLHRLQDRYRAVGSEVELLDADQRDRYARFRTELDRLRA